MEETVLNLVFFKTYYLLVTDTWAFPEKIFCWLMAKQIS
jgi:hypothetical protein